MKTRLFVVGVAVVALLGACGGDEGGSDAEATEGGGGGSVTLVAADFAFEPSSLTAAAGDTIEFTNEDDAEHNFTVEEADIDEDVDAKGSTTIDLSDVEPGSYDFVCEYHADSMTGTLEVTE